MGRKILREIIAPLSVLSMIIGGIMFLMGVMEISAWYKSVDLGVFTDVVKALEYWNYYLFVAGLILLIAGIWYLYDFFRKKNYLLEEIKTDKRSELIKKKTELEEIVKRLPSKYEKMLNDKKRELKIK
ncbi:MAG TPA: DUF3198 domain-containing protein [Thermoplasmatales archaeon]|nr:DUF3198 domain-containing protein [Thermoplasmatales archaeon]